MYQGFIILTSIYNRPCNSKPWLPNKVTMAWSYWAQWRNQGVALGAFAPPEMFCFILRTHYSGAGGGGIWAIHPSQNYALVAPHD